ncbi:MAG TPA: DUF5906 domain-containing protein [Chthoniobacter sp.]|jgi:P4 family phage/plasmid primase-like protien
MSAPKTKYANPGTDGSDASLSVHPDSAQTLAATGVVEIDSVVTEHGTLFTIDGDTIHANQVAIAAKFSRDHQVRFDPELGEFLIYHPETGLWEATKEPAVKMLLARFIKTEAEKNQATDFLPKRTNAFLAAVLQILKGFTLPANKNSSMGAIHVGNGMLDLTQASPVLSGFNPEHWSRRMCAVAYRPEAKCPRFLDELLTPALVAEDIDLLQRIFGGVLLGENTAQRVAIICGEAARGKSTVVTVGEEIVGLENVAHLRTDHLPGRFETHGFLNKSLLTAKDVPSNFLERSGAPMLKALVGDDLVEAEAKYGGKFRMRGRFNVVITTNNRLRLAIEEDAPAWRRRLLVLNFAGNQPKQRIANFADLLLREESEGILAWMIEGAIKHLKELDEIGDFRLSAAQQTRIDDLIDSSRSPEVFVRTAITKETGAVVTVEELTEGYLDFCAAKEWEPFTARQFENVLTNLMQRIHRVLKRKDLRRGEKTLRGFKHVGLNPLPTNPPA